MKRKPQSRDVSETVEVIFYWCFFLVFLYLIIIFLSPLLIQSSNRILLGVGVVSYVSNVLMCHQLPERSLQLFGQYMPICSRDTGLFLGVFFACIFSFASSRLPKFLKNGWLAVLSAIPLGVDGVMQLLGFWESTNIIRLATGIFAGFCISYYSIWVFIDEPRLNRRALTALLLLIPVLVVILVASLYAGGTYLTKAEILSKAKAINNFTSIDVFYIAPRAFGSSIAADPYAKNYDDTVMSDVARMRGNSDPYGVWVAVASNHTYTGRYVFASGNGVNYFYDAMSGKLIAEFEN